MSKQWSHMFVGTITKWNIDASYQYEGGNIFYALFNNSDIGHRHNKIAIPNSSNFTNTVGF